MNGLEKKICIKKKNLKQFSTILYTLVLQTIGTILTTYGAQNLTRKRMQINIVFY